MKFTVEVEEFYLEEGELAIELKKQIQSDIIAQMRKEIKTQVDTFMDQHVKSVLQSELKTRTQLIMDDFLATGKVKGRYSGDGELTVKEYIAKEFNSRNADIGEMIVKQVTAQVKELQKRYDLLFASQIITKIKEQGFLKEDVAKMLLTTEEGN